jgi:nucleoside-diphosphate-sugar epimerase
MVSDQHDISIGELSRVIAAAMGKPARLLPVPPALLRVTAILMGKRDVATRLLDALQVDTTPASELLGWKPPVTLEDGIERTVRHFLACST